MITGAAGGFGRVLVPAFLGVGAKVAALDVSEKGLAELENDPANSAFSEQLLTRVCDISDFNSCEAAVNKTLDTLGGLHLLINNAGLGMGEIREDSLRNLVTIDE